MKHPPPTVRWAMENAAWAVHGTHSHNYLPISDSTITITCRRDQSGVPQPQRPSNAMIHGLSDQRLGLLSHSGGLITVNRARARTLSLSRVSYSQDSHLVGTGSSEEAKQIVCLPVVGLL